MNCAAGERGRERAWNGEREKERGHKKAQALHSLSSFQPRTRKWVSDTTQKNLFIRLLYLSLVPLSPRCSLPHRSFSLFLSDNFPSFFPLQKRYFSANDLIRGAIWNSITVDFTVTAAIWRMGGRDVRMQWKFIFFDLIAFCFLIVIIISRRVVT